MSLLSRVLKKNWMKIKNLNTRGIFIINEDTPNHLVSKFGIFPSTIILPIEYGPSIVLIPFQE